MLPPERTGQATPSLGDRTSGCRKEYGNPGAVGEPSYATGAGSFDSPIKNVSMPRAALRPSAIAHTMRD